MLLVSFNDESSRVAIFKIRMEINTLPNIALAPDEPVLWQSDSLSHFPPYPTAPRLHASSTKCQITFFPWQTRRCISQAPFLMTKKASRYQAEESAATQKQTKVFHLSCLSLGHMCRVYGPLFPPFYPGGDAT